MSSTVPPEPDEASAPFQVVLRPVGSAVPVALCGLALASLILSGLDLGWFAVSESRELGALLLVTGGAMQLLGALVSFAGRDGAAGSGMGVLAAGWTAIGLTHLMTAPGATTGVLGVLLVGAGGLVVLTSGSVAASKLVLACVIALAGVRFVLTGVYQLSGSDTWQDVSGIVGLVAVAAAAYGAAAFELEDAYDRERLPIGRRRLGRIARSGPMAAQVESIGHEPGVRRRL